MTFLAPVGLALAVTLPVLVVFYLLKIRPQDRPVGSIYLWERLLPEIAAHQPWQKPRFPPLFFIQALLLAALVVAAGRPAIVTPADEPVAAIAVVDVSASMKANDVQPSRLVLAKEQARAMIDQLPTGSVVAVIAAGAGPLVVMPETADRAAARGAVAAIGATDASGNLHAALRLATSLASHHPNARIDVFTDGSTDLPADLADIPVPFVWHPVGRDPTNFAITEFSARSDARNQRQQQVFLRLQRFGPPTTDAGDSVLVSLYASDDSQEQIVETRTLTIGPREVAETVFDNLPEWARVIEARIASNDALPADDRAALVVERARSTRVLLVSRGNVFLEKSLGLIPHIELDRILPRQLITIVPEDYDILVFDTEVPAILPNRPMLLVNPTDSTHLSIGDELRRPQIVAWDREHPILRHVDLAEVNFARAPQIGLPGWAQPVVEGTGGPLILASIEDDRRIVAFNFDLHETNLPLLPAFPILIANTIGFLEPPGLLNHNAIAPGQEVTITPLAEAREIVVRSPTGVEASLPIVGPSATFAQTGTVGKYLVIQRRGEETVSESVFTVNLLDEAESDIRPRTLPEIGRVVEPTVSQPIARELWTWPLLLGVAVLLTEWWWYHRR